MPFVATAFRMSSGVMVWALHFAAIYGYTGIACARGYAHTVPWVIGFATAVAAIAALAIVVTGYRQREAFESWMAAAIGASAFVAIVWEALPVLIVPVCG